MKFFGHLNRLPGDRLTKRMFNYVTSLKASTPWVTEVKKDLVNAKISLTDTLDRVTFRTKINTWNGTLEQPRLKPYRPKWTEERKKAFGDTMRKYWANKKNSQKK